MSGRLIAVVGPSGAGKDAVIDGLVAACPRLHRVRRVITRAPGDGEDFEPVSPEAFQSRAAAGEFALHWPAHGLHYGISEASLDVVRSGGDAIVNLSRTVLRHAAHAVPVLVVLVVTAAPEVRAHRLAGRGRETEAEIAARLDRDVTLPDLPAHVRIFRVSNDGPLDATVAAARGALYPERGTRAI